MSDPTEPYRRQRLAEINADPDSREALEAQHGQVWSTDQLSDDFEVIGFMAPLVAVRRRSDGVTGSNSSVRPGSTSATRHMRRDASSSKRKPINNCRQNGSVQT